MNSTAFTVTLFGRDWAPRIKHACNEIARDNGANLFHVAVGTAPKAMFIFLPLVAFLHMLMYWRPRHKYAEHLLFFLHVHAFFFSVMTLVVLVGGGRGRVAGLEFHREPGRAFAMVLAGLHRLRHAAGVRRSWTRTLVKASALFVVYMVVLAITLAGVFVYAVLQM